MKYLLKIIIPILILCYDHNIFGQDIYKNDYFNFNDNWEWNQLLQKTNNPETLSNIKELKAYLSIDEGRFLLLQLSKLNKPEDIKKLNVIEKQQSKRGGGFYGIVPDYFSNIDSIPIPNDFDNIIKTALYLTKIRSKIYKIISNPDFEYPVSFTNEEFPDLPTYNFPDNMHLEFDFTAIENLLDFFTQREIHFNRAIELAKDRTFLEMLKHRRQLGYVPEPLPDSSDLGQFIFHAASRKPLNMIWKWLNPWNYFCLSDLYLNQVEYRNLVNTLKSNKNKSINYILGRIALFSNYKQNFNERLSFAVNWGIRSWATEYSLGTNIVQFKDDYQKMLRTITHETFHRLQLKLCPVDPSLASQENRKFEYLVLYKFPTQEDRKFYEALTYIMLEGTATLVGGIDTDWNVEQNALEGKKLLEELYESIYVQHDFKKSEQLLNYGLKSNGPFYGLGYYMSKVIVDRMGKKEIGELLKKGSITFFKEYCQIVNKLAYSENIFFNENIVKQLNSLADLMDTN